MSEQNDKTVNEQIEDQRQEFKRDTEKMIFEEIKSELEAILKEDKHTVTAEAPKQKTDQQENPKPKECPEQNYLKNIFEIYGTLLALVLIYLGIRSFVNLPLRNNECIVLVTVLILATVVLILTGRYCLVMVQLQHEKEKADKKDDKKKYEPEPSFKEKMLKRIQEAVLDKVVEDTIKSFD